jgi:hypothetical protein
MAPNVAAIEVIEAIDARGTYEAPGAEQRGACGLYCYTSHRVDSVDLEESGLVIAISFW